MKIKISTLRRVIREAIESDLDDQIEDLRTQPEFSSLASFAQSKLDDDVYEYNFVELQALARNRLGGKDISEARPADVAAVRRELESLGFKFVGRRPVRTVRGARSPSHGSHPFAGMIGGSGIGDTGPGAVGGDYKWSASDAKNLPMGSRRRS